MGGEYSNESRKLIVKLQAFAPLFNAQIKHILNYVALEMAAIIVARKGSTENREKGRRERVFPHINLFGNNTLSEHINCQAMLFLICFTK